MRNLKSLYRLLAVATLCLAFAGCAAQQTAVSPPTPPGKADWTITVSWEQDFTNFVACSSTVTKGCISGYTWGYLQGSTQVPVKTAAASVCSGSTQPETCTDSGNATVGIGAVTFYCVANYIDNAGNAASTAPITTAQPDNVALSGFGNLTEVRR